MILKFSKYKANFFGYAHTQQTFAKISSKKLGYTYT